MPHVQVLLAAVPWPGQPVCVLSVWAPVCVWACVSDRCSASGSTEPVNCKATAAALSLDRPWAPAGRALARHQVWDGAAGGSSCSPHMIMVIIVHLQEKGDLHKVRITSEHTWGTAVGSVLGNTTGQCQPWDSTRPVSRITESCSLGAKVPFGHQK